MAFIWRCDNCSDEREYAHGHQMDGQGVQCEWCGQDGCPGCILPHETRYFREQRLCETCWEDLQEREGDQELV